MTTMRLRWPGSTVPSLLAGLTTWIALWAWAGFTESASGFLVPCLGACLMVAVTGMLLRSARVPTLLVPLGQLAVLVLWLNHTWAGDLMLGGWIPTPSSMEEVGLRIQDGSAAAQGYAAPVPESVPQIHALLIVAGSATAVVVDFLACGLRRVPVAGLPLLAVYTAPVSILDGGVSWWGFVLGAMSFLFLLASDEARRLAHWGRQIGGSQKVFDSVGTNVSTAAVRSSARKIGFTATGLAVILPIFIPTLSASFFDGNGPGSGGDGDSVSISNPIVDLKRDLSRGQDVDLVWVTTPDANPSYLRISVLDFFDGKTWKPSGRDIPVEQRAEGRMPRPPGLEPDVDTSEVPYEIETSSSFDSRWLPTPYPVASIEADGDWRYDTSTLDFISAADGQDAKNMRYELEALQVEATAEGLAAAGPTSEDIFTPNTALPSSLPDSVRQLARDVTAQQAGKFDKAVRLQQWFREDGGFEYSLRRSPGGSGTDDLEQFLGTGPDGRTGYCEQFAAAMAVMGRALGIPSRVAVGFLRPDKLSGDRYVYSAHDMHAWPEMYFEGTGWIRFEPTPQDRATGVPSYTTAGSPSDEPSQSPSTANPNQGQNPFEQQESSAPAPVDKSGGSGSDNSTQSALTGFIGALVVLALLGAPRLARSLLRRRRWERASEPVAVAEAAWSELRDSAIDLGLPWDDSVTLRTRARSLVASFGEPGGTEDEWTRRPVTGPQANPEATDALQRLVEFVERARYSRSVDMQDVTDDVALCVQAMRDGTTRQRRFRATWLPESLVRGLSTDPIRQRREAEGRLTSEPGIDHAV
jgi:transglutaminase-like putative cysteine protease